MKFSVEGMLVHKGLEFLNLFHTLSTPCHDEQTEKLSIFLLFSQFFPSAVLGIATKIAFTTVPFRNAIQGQLNLLEISSICCRMRGNSRIVWRLRRHHFAVGVLALGYLKKAYPNSPLPFH